MNLLFQKHKCVLYSPDKIRLYYYPNGYNDPDEKIPEDEYEIELAQNITFDDKTLQYKFDYGDDIKK